MLRTWTAPRFALTLVLVTLAGCWPDEKAFYGGTFYCDANHTSQQCGTTKEGAPLTCFAGRQLGEASDFCVEQCPAKRDFSADSDSVCLESKAALATCRPSVKTDTDPNGCGPNLACYRTDLSRDEGVCLAIRVCSVDKECPGVGSCAASVLRDQYPGASFETSNLHCVHRGCKEGGTACPYGETCLPLVVPAVTRPPDICVPSCDSNLNCPPNYFCWRRLSGPDSPNVCLPGLQGARCTSSLDCMIGECLDTGEGFSLCSLPCQSHEDCIPYSDNYQRLFCVAQAGATRKHCLPLGPFAGAICLQDSTCPAPQRCFFTSPYHRGRTVTGECRLPCAAEDRCPVRSGLAHACFVRGADRSCYPGRLGVTCQRSEECLGSMTCEAVPPEQRLTDAAPDGGTGGENRVCTLACSTDADCHHRMWAHEGGYCEAGWCRLGDGPGGPCTRDTQCRNNQCNHEAGARGVCL